MEKTFYILLVREMSDIYMTDEQIMEEGVDCYPPGQDEVRTTNTRIKNKKASGVDGLHAELLETGGDKLIICLDV